jgi:putative intracellular protease/amidase
MRQVNKICFLPIPKKKLTNTIVPTRFGYVLFPAIEALDVFGPLEALNLLSFSEHMNLTPIAETLEPVSTKVTSSAVNPLNAIFGESVVPTHIFETAPPLDVIIIPGGPGTRAPAPPHPPPPDSAIAFVKDRYPSLQYLITVCTGAGIAARTGVLDYKHATTNKEAWALATALGPKVK